MSIINLISWLANQTGLILILIIAFVVIKDWQRIKPYWLKVTESWRDVQKKRKK